jgi:hypothetical protein
MSRFTGIDGTVKSGGVEVTPVTAWDASITADLKEYHDNTCGKAKKRTKGVEDSSGSLEVMLDSGMFCPVTEGAEYDLQLHVDDTGNNFLEIPAKVESIAIADSITSPDNLVYKIAWKGNGDVVKHGILAISGSAGSSGG